MDWTDITQDDGGQTVIEMLERNSYMEFRDNQGGQISLTESELRRVPCVAKLVDENARLRAAVHAANQGGNVIMPTSDVEKGELLAVVSELASLSVAQGIDTGLARAGADLRDAAGRLFANGQDINAKKMRDAAGVVERLQRKLAKDNRLHVTKKGAVWERLCKMIGAE